ncbi:MAG TPA: hypothetical protein VE981_08725 [Planctomycetota bacterium]|nr:hypothetical protein [Planctomycetota bacterium]
MAYSALVRSFRRVLAGVLIPAALSACSLRGDVPYREGLSRFQNGDYGRAQEQFALAVGENPRFSEAYVYLSIAKIRAAREAAAEGRNAEASRLWRESTDDRRTAKQLMDEGWFFVTPEFADRAILRKDAEAAIASAAALEKISPRPEDIVSALKSASDGTLPPPR